MIGKARTGTSFGGLQGYLLHGRAALAESEPGLQDYLLDGKSGAERVAWATTRNLYPEDPRYASLVMSATAEQNPRVQKPVYHLSLSASPGEELGREQWESIVDRVLGKLGLQEHQALVVAHNDTQHPHVHVMVNRVHPEHLKAWSTSHDFMRIERELRHLERDLKLREVPGRHFQLDGKETEHEARPTGNRRQPARAGDGAWADRVRFKIYEDLRRAESWGDLERRLAGHRLRLQRRGGGLVITDGEHRVKASRIYRRASYRWLEQRFGMSFEEWRSGRRELLDAVARYRELEQRRAYLEKLAERARAEHDRLREQAEDRERIRSACRSAAAEVDRHLREIYRPRDVPKARRRLAADAREHGWREAGRRLGAAPRRYGRYRATWRRPRRGYSHRRMRGIRLRRLVSVLRDLAVLRAARLVGGPQGFRAVHSVLFARRTLQWAARRRDRLPDSSALLKEIGSRALSLGISGVSLAVAPEPLKVIRFAVRAVQLTHTLARGRGR